MPEPVRLPRGLAAALREARHVVALTGAGVSAESGVPTFREAATGLWATFDPLELATPEAFDRDPELVWRWYRWRRSLISGAKPNPGHYALAQLGQRLSGFTLITQNVDDLHRRAGSTDLIEFHGNIFDDRCERENKAVTVADTQAPVPLCPDCGARLRPGVVWFGEAIPQLALQAANAAVGRCDLFLSIGTSSQVWPAAGLAAEARRGGAGLVEINPEKTGITDSCDFYLDGESGRWLPELVNSLSPSIGSKLP